MARTPVKSSMSPFDSFQLQIKKTEDGKEYQELDNQQIEFSAELLYLADIHNLELLMQEMNKIPSLLFRYRSIMDTQTKVVQQLEDEFSRWYAKKWMEVANQEEPRYDKAGNLIGTKKVERTETGKEKYIMTTYSTEYNSFQDNLREEKYKLSLLKSAVTALDNYSYKLHSILTYQQMLESKKIS